MSFKAGDLCEFVPRHSGGGLMYELPLKEIRDGKVCQPQFDNWRMAQAGGYCSLPSDGPYIVLLVMKAELDPNGRWERWAALYQESLVEVYASKLVKVCE